MRKQRKAFQVAFPAILSALSLVLIYAASVAPSGSWGIVAVAGLLPAAAVVSIGKKSGLLCWFGTTILAFLLIPGKFCALLYGVLFGLYPIVKGWIECLNRRLPELILKILYFNAAFTVLFLIMKTAVLGSLPAVFSKVWLLYIAGNIVFLIYDFGLTRLISIYISRFRSAIR